MNREEQICETCKENDNGFCDRIGRMVEDDDWCAKWKTKEVPEWKARMMNTFLAGSAFACWLRYKKGDKNEP